MHLRVYFVEIHWPLSVDRPAPVPAGAGARKSQAVDLRQQTIRLIVVGWSGFMCWHGMAWAGFSFSLSRSDRTLRGVLS